MAKEQKMFQLRLGGVDIGLVPEDYVEYAVLLLADGKRPSEVKAAFVNEGKEKLVASIVACAVLLRAERKKEQ